MERGSDDSVMDPAQADAPLEPTGAAGPPPVRRDDVQPQPPPAWVAQALIQPAIEASDGLVYMASSERRADEIGRALRQFAPQIEVLVLPPWDCLPYDRASPSREIMGRRMAVLQRLREPADGARVLIAPAETLLQKAPPAKAFKGAFLDVVVGEPLPRDRLEGFGRTTGYVSDDRIDEPGEIAILGEVADIFPAGAETPVRITLGEGDVVLEIRRYDPLTQRSEAGLEAVRLGPASELILEEPADERELGAEHRAAAVYGRMDSVLKLLPKASIALDPRARERAADFDEQVHEAHEARRSLSAGEAAGLTSPDKLYLTPKALFAEVDGRAKVELAASGIAPIPNFALERNPGGAFSGFVAGQLEHGRHVILAGLRHELRPVLRAVKRGLERSPEVAADWPAALVGDTPGVVALEADVDAGFVDADAGVVLIAASDVLGGRVAHRTSQGPNALIAEPDLRVGDVVLHEDHGVGVLTALERVVVDEIERDALRIEYHGEANLLAPIEEFGRIWRYSAEAEAVSLDRLHTDHWQKKRVELSLQIEETARGLVDLAKERAARQGSILEPPKTAYARFAARFPYPETADQSAAVEAVLADLASGRVMNRLICGDVGFGKTEVALRAAAAAALAGKQVAVVAPTTVLARQHYETFRRRFAGTGVAIGHVSRLTAGAEAQAVKAGMADGSIGVVIGTHALAAEDVTFKDLGLLIIDEEQRFGAKLKAKLAALAPDVHRLTLTATPIPRTLRLAMVGVEDVSLLATPPARRRPIRTFLAPYDAATVRTALLRERRRGGQSFLVVPRIDDIDAIAEELGRLVPELSVRIAHGGLAPEAVDEAMVGFASGEGDVLLATNIIESGLDVPRANTMLVWRAELFGLAQLHQLRGRVGRGRAQGIAYLLTDPAHEVPEATRARLSTLVAFDRLGSGLAISARDLEMRGAGDLLGEEQAGHVTLIGTALYQKLLTQAVRAAKGETVGPEVTPVLNIGLTGVIPETYVPDATVRINLYARLARLGDAEAVEAFAEELEDRFGPVPAEAEALLALARLQALSQAAGVAKIDAGPKAIALTLSPGVKPKAVAGVEASGDRLVLRKAAAEDASRIDEVEQILRKLA
jgi:transcription-repair coupling factor (superfamily II helicase)